MEGRRRIDAEVVNRVLEGHRQEMRRLLSPEEWQRLARLEREKSAAPDPALESLLELGAVVEHFGRREAFTVHPVLQPLLRETGGG